MPGPVQYQEKRAQSGTGMSRYRTEIRDARNADAGGIDLDADAQLCPFLYTTFNHFSSLYGLAENV
jgi:hypothetical protein